MRYWSIPVALLQVLTPDSLARLALGWYLLSPVDDPEPVNMLILLYIVGDQRQAAGPGLGGDHRVVSAYRVARSCKFSTDFAKGVGGLLVKVDNMKPCGESLDVFEVALLLPGPHGAEVQFAERNRGQGHAAAVSVELPAYGSRPVLDRVDRDIRIKQKFNHPAAPDPVARAGCDRS